MTGPIRFNEFGEEVIEEGSFSLDLPDDSDYYNANNEHFITLTKEERQNYLKERYEVYRKTVGTHTYTDKQKQRVSRGTIRSWSGDKGLERKAKVHKQDEATRDKIRNAARGRRRHYLPDGSWIWEKR